MGFDYAVALTGSIATGKSTVAKFFNVNGFKIIDADKIAHGILDEQHEVIENYFGKACVKEGRVDRKVLGKIIFSDTKKRESLEKVLHPLIFEEIKNLSFQEDRYKRPYFVDIPLFFEHNRYPIKRVLVVYTPKQKQIERLMQRGGYSKKEALMRIETQIDIEYKRKHARYVIDNSKDLHHLIHECQKAKEEILGDFR